jgi:hypothetical protein
MLRSSQVTGAAPKVLIGAKVSTATAQRRASGASPAIIPTFGRSGCHLGPKGKRLTYTGAAAIRASPRALRDCRMNQL